MFKGRFFRWGDSIKETCEIFLDAIVDNKTDEFSWFDYEIKSYFDIDVYSEPFDIEKGYSVYSNGNVELLLIKLERISELENVIKSFLNNVEFRLIRNNSSDSKIYRFLYSDIKKNIHASDKYMDYYINNSKALNFYSADEILSKISKGRQAGI